MDNLQKIADAPKRKRSGIRQPSFKGLAREITAGEHGGERADSKRKSARPLCTEGSLHAVLKSDRAFGERQLVRHRALVRRVLSKASALFHIKIFGYAVHFNHIHIHARGSNREEIQNFFRVVAGHIAQEILRALPLSKTEASKKRQRKFWRDLLYSRTVTPGPDFRRTSRYMFKNEYEVAIAEAGVSSA